jgi:hypothetical protein
VPRVGLNPLKNVNAPAHFPPVLVTVITHLPNEEGYHAERFEIIKRCLETMRGGAPGTPVLVWDNGSNARLKEYLTNEYKPDYLTLSPNIGKQSALAAIAHLVPPDTLITFSDDDMEFKTGWLDASLELFNGFPNVGAVSTWAVRPSFGWGNTSTLAWARKHAVLEEGYFIPLDEVRDYCVSIGEEGDLPEYRYMARKDIRITYKGLRAYAAAQHCQFLTRAGTFAPFTKYSETAVGNERPLDIDVDEAGLLRLTTTKQYARHLGNRF